MKQGDFTLLAQKYINRPGYSSTVIQALARHVGSNKEGFLVADVGAGTGKLTEMLAGLGLGGYAVEPNEAMRMEGRTLCQAMTSFQWLEGSAEHTHLPAASVDWVCMASSFHWTDAPEALREFHRILRPGGYLTVMWNPRDIENDPLQARVEEKIRQIVPDLRRQSSGAKQYTQDLEEILLRQGLFGDILFSDAPHFLRMSHERYLGAWESVNDIHAQAGEDRWGSILGMIQQEIAKLGDITVRYRTRAWTVRALIS